MNARRSLRAEHLFDTVPSISGGDPPPPFTGEVWSPGPSPANARSKGTHALTLIANADGLADRDRNQALKASERQSSKLRSTKRAAALKQLRLVDADEVAAPEPFTRVLDGDARKLPLPDASADLIVTSPPYWNKRDYGVEGQIGQERTPAEYVATMLDCLREWRRVLRPTGSVFINIGDTFYKKSLAGIPGRLEAAANDDGWLIRNRVIWTKDRGMPEPAQNRLANRHEYVIHLVPGDDYYYDLLGYSQEIGNGTNPGDVWHINPERYMGRHLAPFPTELVRRAILLGCPELVCGTCGQPRRRIVKRTRDLDLRRVQARRAIELAEAGGLTDEHIAAIQATGVSDAGKALKTQNGTGRNSAEVQRLAAEAKAVLGGYFREFTFALRRTVGWTTCEHPDSIQPGVVLDPFMGTGTTLRTARSMGRSAIGVDLLPHWP
jgi:DNA modification methylase